MSQPTASSPVTASGDEAKEDTPKPKKNKCFMCRKRVGLTGERATAGRGASQMKWDDRVEQCIRRHAFLRKRLAMFQATYTAVAQVVKSY